MDVMHYAGLYAIENLRTGHRYVGSTATRFRLRRNQHWHKLRRGTHENSRLQRAWKKYGESAFAFRVLAVLDRSKPQVIAECEQRMLDLIAGRPDYYNLATFVDHSNLGRKFGPLSAEHRAKIGAAHRGRRPSDATIAAAIAANRTRVPTAETRRRISAAKKGVPLPTRTSEHRRNNGRARLRTHPGCVAPNGRTFPPIADLPRFCAAHGLNYRAMSEVLKGQRVHHRGWRMRPWN